MAYGSTRHHQNYNPKYEECILEDLIKELSMPESLKTFDRFSCQGEGSPLMRDGLEIIDCHGNSDLACGWKLTGPYPLFRVRRGQSIITSSNISTVMRKKALKSIIPQRRGHFQSTQLLDSPMTISPSEEPQNSSRSKAPLESIKGSESLTMLEPCRRYRENKEYKNQSHSLAIRTHGNGPAANYIAETQRRFQNHIRDDIIKEMERVRLKEHQLNMEVQEEKNPKRHLEQEPKKVRKHYYGRRSNSRESNASKEKEHQEISSKTSMSIDEEDSIVITAMNGCVRPVKIPVLTCSLGFDYERFRDRMKHIEGEMQRDDLCRARWNNELTLLQTSDTCTTADINGFYSISASRNNSEASKVHKIENNIYPNVKVHPPHVVADYVRNHKKTSDQPQKTSNTFQNITVNNNNRIKLQAKCHPKESATNSRYIIHRRERKQRQSSTELPT